MNLFPPCPYLHSFRQISALPGTLTPTAWTLCVCSEPCSVRNSNGKTGVKTSGHWQNLDSAPFLNTQLFLPHFFSLLLRVQIESQIFSYLPNIIFKAGLCITKKGHLQNGSEEKKKIKKKSRHKVLEKDVLIQLSSTGCLKLSHT